MHVDDVTAVVVATTHNACLWDMRSLTSPVHQWNLVDELPYLDAVSSLASLTYGSVHKEDAIHVYHPVTTITLMWNNTEASHALIGRHQWSRRLVGVYST